MEVIKAGSFSHRKMKEFIIERPLDIDYLIILGLFSEFKDKDIQGVL